MKKIILLMLLTKTCFAQSFFAYKPEFQMGIGLNFPSSKQEPLLRPNLVAKEYFFTFAEDEFTSVFFGSKVLGVGGQIDTQGTPGVVLSPGCVYLLESCLGPELIYDQKHNLNFGLSWTLRFF